MIEKVCPSCYTVFFITGKGYQKKFCSRPCSNKRKFSEESRAKTSKSMKIAQSKRTNSERLESTRKAVEVS